MTEKRPATDCGSSSGDYSSASKRPKTNDCREECSLNADSAGGSCVSAQDTLEYEMWDPLDQDDAEKTTQQLKCSINSLSVTGKTIPSFTKNSRQAGIDNNCHESSIYLSNEVGASVGESQASSSVKRVSTPPPALWKSTSLEGDARTIKSVFPNANLRLVYETLAKHRTDPERLDITTEALLDISDGDKSSTGVINETNRATTNLAENVLNQDVKKVVQLIQESNPVITLDLTEVYIMLQQYVKNEDRVKTVAETILTRAKRENGDYNHFSQVDSIFDKAIKLNAEFPDIHPSVIYEMLEREGNNKDELDSLRKTLANMVEGVRSKGLLEELPQGLDNSQSDDSLYWDDPVYRDMRTISKVFPHRDQNEIYALVEAHYYKKDRIQVVIDELTMLEQGSQAEAYMYNPAPSPEKRSSEIASATSAPLEDLQPEIDSLQEIFPDCDPNYIYDRLEGAKHMKCRVKMIAEDMFERKDYPRLKDLVEKQTRESHKQRLQRLDFTLEDFLAKFPDPQGTFMDEGKEMKENYKNHIWAQLSHDFPTFKHSFVKKVVEQHKYHFLPIVQELEATMADILNSGGQSRKLRKSPLFLPLEYPQEPEEYFFYELWYTKNEHIVRNCLDQKEKVRMAKINAARDKNELHECPCCFEEECLFEEMSCCADGHLFCQNCIVRAVNASFSEGKTKFPCLTGNCKHEIPLSVLKSLLPAPMFSKILKKLQEEEVRSAGIEDLVECPFCNFATIMSDKNDRVFKCLNPECLKDSCRLCREPNHIPLKCSEVEKQNETDMRTFIEKRVTEAMLRKCHQCGKHFVKESGCNKMTCVCGATSCYVCRAPDIDYSHFNGTRCYNEDMNMLHQREMEEAAAKARAEYLQKYPEAADIQLKHDPLQHLENGDRTRAPDQHFDEQDEDERMFVYYQLIKGIGKF